MGKILTKLIKEFGSEDIFDRAAPGKGTLGNGSLVTFTYKPGAGSKSKNRGERFGLVVKAKPPGSNSKLPVWYCTGTGNQLVNVIKLNSEVSMVIRFISDELNKASNKKGITIKQLSGLEALVGKGSFRTYIISKMTDLHVLDYIPREGSPKKLLPKKKDK